MIGGNPHLKLSGKVCQDQINLEDNSMSFSAKSIYNWYRNAIRNPKYRWWIILGTLGYLVSPIDIVPDFLPIIGQVDDLTVLTLLISEVSQLLTERVKARKAQINSDAANANSDNTVEVDAVSVK